jgi:hypothetical protein
MFFVNFFVISCFEFYISRNQHVPLNVYAFITPRCRCELFGIIMHVSH